MAFFTTAITGSKVVVTAIGNGVTYGCYQSVKGLW